MSTMQYPKRSARFLLSSSLLALGCSPRGVESSMPARSPAQAGSALPAAGAAAEPPARLEQARSLHLLGVAGDDRAGEAALEMLVALAQEHPEDSEVLAHLGSAKVLAAKRYTAPWRKGATCSEGLKLLDDAVAREPESVGIRFLRAVSTCPLPGFFGRREQSAADFAWLSERSAAAVKRGEISPAMAALVLLHHGRFRAEGGDLEGAAAAWRGAAALAPDSEPAEEARGELARRGMPARPGEP